MQDSITIIAAPAIIGATINWKLDLLVSIPITIIATALSQQQSFSVENDNMSCYAMPEEQANRMTTRLTVNMLCMVVVAYIVRYTSLKRFLE